MADTGLMTRVGIDLLIGEFGGWRAFADFMGVSQQAIGQYRRRDTLPLKRALQVAEYYNLSPEFFHDPWVDAGLKAPRATVEEFRAAVEGAR